MRNWHFHVDMINTWLVLSLGIITAQECFQLLPDEILQKELAPELQMYLDDLIVATDTWAQHWDKLKKLLAH